MNAEEKALQVIAQVSGREAAGLSAADELVADLGLDSPRALQLIVELEEQLGIEIQDEDAAKMDTVGDVLAYVARR